MIGDYDFFLKVLKNEFHEEELNDWKSIECWSSMQKLLIMNAINDNYHIIIDHDDFNEAASLDSFHKLLLKKYS
jgi:hypothetical protein